MLTAKNEEAFQILSPRTENSSKLSKGERNVTSTNCKTSLLQKHHLPFLSLLIHFPQRASLTSTSVA